MSESREPRDPGVLDAEALRARLQDKRGREWWRALDEVADHPGLPEALAKDFPSLAALGGAAIDRRQFLKLAAATLAMGGLAACGRGPIQQIVPYVYNQEGVIPGQPRFYATAMPRDGFALGVLAEQNMGRPTKIEGNPKHPANLGGTDAFMQASVLQLWDPDRGQTVMHNGVLSTAKRFEADLRDRRKRIANNKGEGLRVLTGTVTSPLFTHQMRLLTTRYPRAQWHAYQPVNHDNVYEGSRLAFGQSWMPRYDLSKARRVVSLDADFLATPPAHLRHAREFAAERRMLDKRRPPLRLYATASGPSITAAVADHRWPMPASRVADFARQLAAALGLHLPGGPPTAVIPQDDLTALVDDLRGQQGAVVLIAGIRQPPEVHALTYWMNEHLGSKALSFHDRVEANPLGHAESLRVLVDEMKAGEVDTLLIIGNNPVYQTPADVDFAAALAKVPYSIYLGLYDDETAAACHWYVPRTHYLEQWSDLRAFDGTASIVQPLIAPLYDNHSEHQLLALLNGEDHASDYERLRAFWRKEYPHGDFDRRWNQWLYDGVIADSAFPLHSTQVKSDLVAQLPPRRSPAEEGLTLQFHPDPTVWDGEYSGLGWLQELPKPLSRLTWDNAAIMAPATAKRLGFADQDLVEISSGKHRIKAPVLALPGMPEDTVSVSLGYGRTRAGITATGLGFDAYRLRTLDDPWFQAGAQLRATGGRYALARAQHHFSLEGRDIYRLTTYDEFVRGPDHEIEVPPPSLYPDFEYKHYKWAMSVDLNTCIGCAACVVACQAENNIPVVGKDQVLAQREMHWLRIDRYYLGEPDNPDVGFQPVPCMQCERAPCEVVCPVEASIHDDSGINVQVYNRCIGTRFCSNNCPYKVRRFNFLEYARNVPSLNLQRNPEVTVRGKGVMEKCNYCLQRVTRAGIMADERGKPIQDGEVVTACQAACPTNAIVFGDLNNPDAEIQKHKHSPLDYAMLKEENTRPRTTYLTKVKHRNARLGRDEA